MFLCFGSIATFVISCFPMSSSKSPKTLLVSADEAEFAHICVTAKHSHEIEDYISRDLLTAIRYYAQTKRTKEMSIFSALLGTVSTICAEKVSLQIAPDYKRQCPAINFLVVCKPGSGKSQAIQDFCLDNLDYISMKKKNKRFYDNPSTFAAYRTFICETKGFGSVINDEIAGTLINISTSEEISASVLNKIWGGQAITLSFKTATSLRLSRTSSTFLGSIHPTDFANIINSWSSANGLQDRWLITAVDDIVTDIPESQFAKRNLKKPEVEFQDYFLKLYEYFEKSEQHLLLTYTDDAFNQIANLSSDLKRMRILHNEKIERGEGCTSESAYLSKMEDNIQKYSMLMHILCTSYESYVTTKTIQIPTAVLMDTVNRSMRFVNVSSNAFKEFANLRRVTSSKSRDLPISMLPGKFVTCRLYNETYASRKNFTRLQETEFTSKIISLEQMGLGVVKEFSMANGKTANAFFKCPPSAVSKDTLCEAGIIPTAYRTAYEQSFSIPRTKLLEMSTTLDLLKAMNEYQQKDAEAEPETVPTVPPKRKAPDSEEPLIPTGINIY